MAKQKMAARCESCGHSEPRWMGQCPACGTWGTMTEEAPVATVRARAGPASSAPARPISQVPPDAEHRRATGIGELDRVLGGGLVPGSVTLLGGEPGAGKSTLLLQASYALARGGALVLYVSAEESPSQVRLRADRIGALDDRLLLTSVTELPDVLALVAEHDPDVVIVDSVQTIRDPEVTGSAGGVGQVKACAAGLIAAAKRAQMAVLLVGHVTKDGQLAGPRVLEHVVDTVCELSGERHYSLRLLRAVKNRFGAVGEVGCFEMTGEGMTGIDEAGALFLGDAPEDTTGIAITLTVEGRRPLACEVQALVTQTALVTPRRVASGLDHARVNLLCAVLQRRADVDLSRQDVYVSSVGGMRLGEPAIDLALCLAIASAFNERPIPRDVVALAEVGLAGELRLVAETERRLAEAARLGFRAALVPRAYDGDAFGLRVQRAQDLAGALDATSS